MKLNLSSHPILQNLVVTLITALACGCSQEPPEKVSALVNGQAIYEKDVLTPEVIAEIEQIKHKQLNKLIDEKVVSLEADRLHTRGEDLLSFFDRLKKRAIEPSEIKRFLTSFESAAPKGTPDPKNGEIEKAIVAGRLEEARKRYIGELRDRATIRIMATSSTTESKVQ